MLNGLEYHANMGTLPILPVPIVDDITGVYKLTDFDLRADKHTATIGNGCSVYILPLRTHIAEGKNWGQANQATNRVVAWVAKMVHPYTPPSGLRAVDRENTGAK